MAADQLPSYAAMMAAYHSAFQVELQSIIEALPLEPNDRVLEVACGDGVYTRWIAERVGSEGEVVALDVSRPFLEMAREASSPKLGDADELFTMADIEHLPFDDGCFDLAWCAQSLFSLPHPTDAIRGMTRVVKPGGVVAVLESDTMHHLLLPWPIELELALHRAEFDAFSHQSDDPDKFYVGRHLIKIFREVGLTQCVKTTRVFNRSFPLTSPELTFVAEFLRDVSDRVRPHLGASDQKLLDRISDPSSSQFLPNDPDFTLSCVEHVIWGTKAKKG